MQGSDDGEAPYKLRDEPVSHQISLLHLLQHLVPKRLASSRLMPRPVNGFTTNELVTRPHHQLVSNRCDAQHSNQSAMLGTARSNATTASTRNCQAAFCRPEPRERQRHSLHFTHSLTHFLDCSLAHSFTHLPTGPPIIHTCICHDSWYCRGSYKAHN